MFCIINKKTGKSKIAYTFRRASKIARKICESDGEPFFIVNAWLRYTYAKQIEQVKYLYKALNEEFTFVSEDEEDGWKAI